MSGEQMIEQRSDDDKAIRSVIATYQKAGKDGSRDLYHRAFHARAVVCYPSTDDGSLVVTPIGTFADEVAQMVEQGIEVEETARDLRVEIAGDVASVRVDFTLRIGQDTFQGTDFISLAKEYGEWVITHKLYDMRQLPGD